MKNRKGLGKGLDALLTGLQPETIETAESTENTLQIDNTVTKSIMIPQQTRSASSENNGFLELTLDQLTPGRYQPRHEVASANLEPLVESIRAQGIIQPIVVRATANNCYEIIAGERRFRAAKLAGLNSVPVIIKDVKDEQAMAMALIENIQREDLNPIEEAMAYDRLVKEFQLTHIQIAEAVGKSRVTITNSMRLLNLEENIKGMLIRREIEAGHAKVLLGLPSQKQNSIAKMIAEKGLSVRETERLITSMSLDIAKKSSKLPSPPLDPDIRRLQNSLSDKLGASVLLQHSQQGKGKLVIHYNSLDELEGILEHIK